MCERRTKHDNNSGSDFVTQSPVLFKLGLFTAALGLGPLTAFYGSQKYLWEGALIFLISLYDYLPTTNSQATPLMLQ